MSVLEMPPEKNVSKAVSAYFGGDYEAAETLSRQCRGVGTSTSPLLSMLDALLLFRSGEQDVARNKMQAIEEMFPGVVLYDFKLPILRRRGREGWLSCAESRVWELSKAEGIANFIISYPKCGRTWLRMILGVYLLNGEEGDPIELLGLTKQLPDVPVTEVSHDDYPMWKHIDEMIEDKRIYAEKKVVWLVRDPRDVFVSYYFQHTRRKDGELAWDDFSGSIGDFIRHPVGGLESIIKFYNIWARNLHVPGELMVVTYESLHAEQVKTLKKLIGFLGFPDFGEEALLRAIEYCRFENMKKIEANNLLNNSRLQAVDPSDPESFKVRKGKIGGFHEYLDASEVEEVNSIIAATLDPYYKQFGYL